MDKLNAHNIKRKEMGTKVNIPDNNNTQLNFIYNKFVA